MFGIISLYPVGTTTIKWNVKDANNDAAEVTQTVVVQTIRIQ
jgi:hypothetical protein